MDESLPLLFGGFLLTAEVILPEEGASGVLAALGDWNGGFALFVAEGRLSFALSNAGELIEVVADRPVPVGLSSLSVAYLAGEEGRFVLRQDEELVGQAAFASFLPVTFQHGGAALRIGFDTGFPVSRRYSPPARFSGEIQRVLVETPQVDAPNPLEQVRAALHSD